MRKSLEKILLVPAAFASLMIGTCRCASVDTVNDVHRDRLAVEQVNESQSEKQKDNNTDSETQKERHSNSNPHNSQLEDMAATEGASHNESESSKENNNKTARPAHTLDALEEDFIAYAREHFSPLDSQFLPRWDSSFAEKQGLQIESTQVLTYEQLPVIVQQTLDAATDLPIEKTSNLSFVFDNDESSLYDFLVNKKQVFDQEGKRSGLESIHQNPQYHILPLQNDKIDAVPSYLLVRQKEDAAFHFSFLKESERPIAKGKHLDAVPAPEIAEALESLAANYHLDTLHWIPDFPIQVERGMRVETVHFRDPDTSTIIHTDDWFYVSDFNMEEGSRHRIDTLPWPVQEAMKKILPQELQGKGRQKVMYVNKGWQAVPQVLWQAYGEPLDNEQFGSELPARFESRDRFLDYAPKLEKFPQDFEDYVRSGLERITLTDEQKDALMIYAAEDQENVAIGYTIRKKDNGQVQVDWSLFATENVNPRSRIIDDANEYQRDFEQGKSSYSHTVFRFHDLLTRDVASLDQRHTDILDELTTEPAAETLTATEEELKERTMFYRRVRHAEREVLEDKLDAMFRQKMTDNDIGDKWLGVDDSTEAKKSLYVFDGEISAVKIMRADDGKEYIVVDLPSSTGNYDYVLRQADGGDFEIKRLDDTLRAALNPFDSIEFSNRYAHDGTMLDPLEQAYLTLMDDASGASYVRDAFRTLAQANQDSTIRGMDAWEWLSNIVRERGKEITLEYAQQGDIEARQNGQFGRLQFGSDNITQAYAAAINSTGIVTEDMYSLYERMGGFGDNDEERKILFDTAKDLLAQSGSLERRSSAYQALANPNAPQEERQDALELLRQNLVSQNLAQGWVVFREDEESSVMDKAKESSFTKAPSSLWYERFAAQGQEMRGGERSDVDIAAAPVWAATNKSGE